VSTRVHPAPLVTVIAVSLLAGCGSSGTGLLATTHRSSSGRVTDAPLGNAHAAPAPPVSRPQTQTAPATPPTNRPHTQTVPATPVPPVNPNAVPTPAPTGIPANPAAVKVIKAWSDALRRGDVNGAARYFALPSVMINGTGVGGLALVTPIATRADAEAANASLPCGAEFISADQRGRYVNALFRLTNRPGPGGGCGRGVGQTARTNFVIAGGLIQEWIRAPDEPGDNRGRSPTPTVPAAPQQSSPEV
jgi:hypothetical protein